MTISPQSRAACGHTQPATTNGASSIVDSPAVNAWVTAFESMPAMRRVITK